eukprot:m.22942 g.22942  ORF g.22942 m.22942 type:complete len:379 (+) comp14009_c0_seq1:270-1406(+)
MGKFLQLFLVLSVVIAFWIKRSCLWLPQESIVANIVVNVMTMTVQSEWDTHATLPLDEQIAKMPSMRALYVDAEQMPYTIWGDEIGDMLTKNFTRTVQLNIPRRDGTGTVPTTCIIPTKFIGMSTPTRFPLVLYMHSGGMIFGSVSGEMAPATYLSSKAQAVTCSIEYRLAPEHTYPAAMEDALDVALVLLNPDSDVHTQLGDLGQQGWATNFATFGYSAGGYMSAHTSRMLASEGYTAKVAIASMPMTKPYGGTQSETKYAVNPMYSRSMNQWAWSVFLPESMKALATDWRVSLLVDPPAKVIANLPPTYVQVCTMDILRDEGLMFADNMQALGKLLGVAEHNALHVGIFPGVNKGGPGEGVLEEFASVLQRRFSYE